MGLFSRRSRRTSRRALRRAHTKTLKAQARAEKAFHAKSRRKADKVAGKVAGKAEKVGRRARRGAEKAVEAAPAPLSTRKSRRALSKQRAATARSYVGAAGVLSPVLAPFVYQAVSAVRGHVDASRARKLGIGVEQLGEFSGHGAGLSARIAGLEPALAEMAGTHLGAEDVAFRERTTARLAELSTAVHAAERMPTPRRRSAHRAVADDLDRVDTELLHRLGVR